MSPIKSCSRSEHSASLLFCERCFSWFLLVSTQTSPALRPALGPLSDGAVTFSTWHLLLLQYRWPVDYS